MVYFDSAYIAKFYLSEPESDRVRALAEREGRVCCSAIGRVETAQVFHRKLRESAVTRAECAALFDQFESDCESGLWTWLAVTDGLLSAAARRFRRLTPKVPLRSADAIHLTSAREHGLERLRWQVDGAGGAAEALAINASTLRSRMRKLEIQRPAARAGAESRSS